MEPLDDLTRLRRTGLVQAAVLGRIEQEIQQGGSLITHLTNELQDNIPALWQALAEHSARHFIAQPSDAGPIDARLLELGHALDYLVLPRVIKYRTVHLISPDPLLRQTEVEALRPHLNAFVPGGQAILKIDLTPPATFRELFSLIYPDAPRFYKDASDVLPLAALIPRIRARHQRPTPEDRGDAEATVLGVPFVDPEAWPPTAGALGDHRPELFEARLLYPHSRNEVGRLLVLGSLHKTDVQALHTATRQLAEALGDQIDLALTSPRRLAALFRTQPLQKGHPL